MENIVEYNKKFDKIIELVREVNNSGGKLFITDFKYKSISPSDNVLIEIKSKNELHLFWVDRCEECYKRTHIIRYQTSGEDLDAIYDAVVKGEMKHLTSVKEFAKEIQERLNNMTRSEKSMLYHLIIRNFDDV